MKEQLPALREEAKKSMLTSISTTPSVLGGSFEVLVQVLRKVPFVYFAGSGRVHGPHVPLEASLSQYWHVENTRKGVQTAQ